MIRARGEEVGFTFALDKRSRIYNTFDAHRLLHWAELEGRQLALKHALFTAYFTAGRESGRPRGADARRRRGGAGCGRGRASPGLDDTPRTCASNEHFYLDQGIHAVPAVIINERHLI